MEEFHLGNGWFSAWRAAYLAPGHRAVVTAGLPMLDERKRAGPFRYRHRGNLATIGRKAAVADLGRVHLSGLPAWLLWAIAHVWFLIGWRNRVVVALNWLWSYVTFQRGARLITSGEEQMAAASSSVEQSRPATSAAAA